MADDQRDDFSPKTKNILARRVGYRCSNCRKLTSGPQEDPSKFTNIGVAAHITAAAPGGPRYDKTLTPEERSAGTNGIWLCQNCAKLVDNDPQKYPVELLLEWKKIAEKSAADEVEGRIEQVMPGQTKEPLHEYIPPIPPPQAELPEVGDLPPGSRMPFQRNAVFTGREDELKALAQSLLYDGQATVVTGTGGMGKSQLAVEFCYRYGRYFHGVHWLQANQDMQAEVADCGLEMGLKPWPETVPEQAQAVLNAWEQGGARLVVLDDTEKPAVVQEWSPKLQNSRVMVTSRWQDWPADLGLALNKLKTLPREKSLVLLRKLAPKLEGAPDKELDDIADRLGDLPLALDLAGRYLKDRRTLSPKGFMEELEQVGSVLEHSALKDWVKHNQA